MRILLVEDTVDHRELMSLALRRHDPTWEVEEAACGGEALHRLAEEAAYDLVFLDYSLPERDGLEVLAEIRRGATPPPVVMVTGRGDEEVAVAAMKAGAYDYVVKGERYLRRLPVIAQRAVEAHQLAMDRRRAEEALRESEERYRALVENASDIIYTHDLKGNFTSVNPAATRIYGYTAEEILQLDIAQIVDARYLSLVAQKIREKLEGAPSSGPYELLTHGKTGQSVWVEVSTRLIERGHKVVGVQGIARDITKRKYLEEQLLQSQKMEAIGRLAGGIAHDFNNLLIPIEGYSELLWCRFDPNDPLRKHLEQIKRAAHRAASLTQQILAFSRKQLLQPEVLDLNAVLANIGEMLGHLLGEDIELVTVLDPELKSVHADRGQIEQVIMNLAVNARDAMPKGGKLTIKTENIPLDEETSKAIPEALPGQFVRLSVEDTGVGMHKAMLDQIFDPFFSTKSPGVGTGLGLSVVHGIIKQHKGWVNVYSEPGLGSTFKVYLPAFPRKPEAEPGERLSLEAFRGRGERILVVEDEEEVRKFIAEALGGNGYVVSEAASIEEAQVLFEREDGAFRLVFSDVVLPDGSGPELVEQLLSRKPELRVLLSSGYTDERSEWEEILEKGFRYLQKPYILPDLLRTIREVLGYS